MRRADGLVVAAAVLAASFLAGGGATASLALLTDRAQADATFTSAVAFDASAPVVTGSVIAKTTGYLAGSVRQGGAYQVYANVVDASGVASVTADVSAITTGQTGVPLVPGAYTVGGMSYTHRSTPWAANGTLVAGPRSYSVTATDTLGHTATQPGFAVIIDNTRPSGSAVQTANGGAQAGRPEAGDTITLTFDELMEPDSILAGWTGAPTPVVVRIANNAGGDRLTVRNAANTSALRLGTVNLAGTGYVAATRSFGLTATPSTMVQVGSAIVVTLGTPSGTVGTQAAASSMSWSPVSGATDAAGNACRTTAVLEAGPPDVEF